MTQPTKHVRILVTIDPDGKWEAAGSSIWSDTETKEQMENITGDLGPAPWGQHWIEADVPLPVVAPNDVIEGKVSDE